jgi:6-phosphogluconate dehydrogenase
MGGNMVRWLIGGGHECVVFDRSPEAVAELVKEKRAELPRLADFVKKLRSLRRLADGRGRHRQSIADLLPLLEKETS